MGADLLDRLSRALAEPMPRRGVLRLLGAGVVAAIVPGGRSPLASAATRAGTCGPDHRTCPILVNLAPADWCCPGGTPARRYTCDGDYYNPHCSDTCGDADDLPCPSKKKDKDGFSYFTCCSRKIHDRCDDGECVSKVCGPDLTAALADAVDRVRTEFADSSALGRRWLCDSLYSIGAIAWDIAELDPPSRKQFLAKYGPGCTTCGHTVQVGSGCHFAGSVNYVVFGVMMQLCHDNYKGSALASWFSDEAMSTLIVLHKTNLRTGQEAGNLDPSIAWANAGYRGWPKHGGTPPGDRDCKGTCPTSYSGPGLTVRWAQKRIGPK